MSNNVPAIPDSAPSYLAALLQQHPELASINQEALSGSAKPMPPAIVADKGKFLIKADGNETVITFPDNAQNQAAGIVGMPVPMLQAVVLKAKPGKEKAYYVAKYTPGQEAQSPDCYSEDGVTPAADCRLKQCETCASCPQNVFGSGSDASGNPSGGKACSDKKVLAIFAAGSVYRFAVPPASLSGKRPSGLGMSWDAYCNQLSAKGLPLPAVITTVSFDQGDTDYKLNFNFGGMLAEQQLVKLLPLMDTPEVKDVITPRSAPSVPRQTQIEDKSNVADINAAREAKEKADAVEKEKAAEKAKVAADKKKAAEDKKKADAAAAAGAGQTVAGLDLGLGGDMGAGATQAAQPEPAAAGNPSDADLIDSLGL